MEALIKCENLCKEYDGQPALSNVNLEIGRGRIVGLLGPNGSGKTTLIKILCGLLKESSGRVLIDGHAPGMLTKPLVSYLPDRTYFPDWAKALDMLDLFDDFYADFDRKKAEAMCVWLDIRMNQRIKTMSKGTKEKMQLALTMSRKAVIYLLDEPIAGVDPAARDFILDTILKNYNEAGTVLISTHLITDVERVLDEAVFIKEGRVVLHRNVDDIREDNGKSVDSVFREIFKTMPLYFENAGGEYNA